MHTDGIKQIRIAIYRSSSIGDVVLATVCLQVIQELPYPVEVIWLGKRLTNQLLKASYPNLMSIDLEQYQSKKHLLDELRDCSAIIDLQGNLRSRLICLLFWLRYSKPIFRQRKKRDL